MLDTIPATRPVLYRFHYIAADGTRRVAEAEGAIERVEVERQLHGLAITKVVRVETDC